MMRRTVLGLIWAACASTPDAAPSQSGSGGPPVWATKPPRHPSQLVFAGTAEGAATETDARSLAIQKGLLELSLYAGAKLKSEFQAVDQEKNGQASQSVRAAVEIAGQPRTIDGVRVERAETQRRPDGRWNGYALLHWPKAAHAQLISEQSAGVRRAAALVDRASHALSSGDLMAAHIAIQEAENILRPVPSQVSVDHPKYGTAGLLRQALATLDARWTEAKAQRARAAAVWVRCPDSTEPDACSSRLGRLRATVAKSGFRVAELSPPPESEPVGHTAARFVIGVRYRSQPLGSDGPFHFASCRASGSIFDPSLKKMVSATEVGPKKGGHPVPQSAARRSCDAAEQEVMRWLEDGLAAFASKKDTP